MLACTFYSLLFIKFLKLVPYQPLSSRTQMLKISGLSLIFCLSVVAGNVSLRFLPVSFNQAIGATGPFFTALFAVLMTWKTEAMPVRQHPSERDELVRLSFDLFYIQCKSLLAIGDMRGALRRVKELRRAVASPKVLKSPVSTLLCFSFTL